MFSPQMMSQLKLKLPEKKEPLSIARRGVKAPTAGPLSQTKKKQEAALKKIKDMVTSEQNPQQAMVPREPTAFENLYGSLGNPQEGERFATKGYEFLVPDRTKQQQMLGIARRAALSGYGADEQSQALADQENRSANVMLAREALKNYLAKRNDPFRGIDLEGTAKLGASLFGGKAVDITNRPSGLEDFKTLMAASENKQGYEQVQSREAADLLGAMLRPTPTTDILKEDKEFNPNTGRGAAQKEIRATEIDKFGKEAAQAIKTAGKVDDLAAIAREIRSTPKTDVMKQYELASKYNTLVKNIIDEVKAINNYGANFSGIEQELSKANLPGDYSTFMLKNLSGAYTGEETLKAFGEELRARATTRTQALKQGFQRPGEKEFIDTLVGGRMEASQVGRLGTQPGPTNEKAKRALEKLKGMKK